MPYTGPTFWNKTMDTLKHTKNLDTFKHNFKKYLNESFSSIDLTFEGTFVEGPQCKDLTFEGTFVEGPQCKYKLL